jgi:hypothetical protein
MRVASFDLRFIGKLVKVRHPRAGRANRVNAVVRLRGYRSYRR